MKNLFINRAKSLKYTLRGMFLLIKTENAIIVQFSIGIFFIALGSYFEISRVEWIIQLFLIGFVLAVESLNTAVEKVCDFIHPEFHNKIGFIKDISAGAVSFAVITSLIIASIIYYLYLT
jgi:diacylglycerol kinase (ATP)